MVGNGAGRAVRVLLASGVLAAAALASGATPATAATVAVQLDCTATLLDANNAQVPVDGDPNTPGRQPQIANQTVNAPADVEVGLPVTFALPSGDTALPATSTGFTINQFTDISTSYKVVGGTIVPGSVSADGPPLINGAPGTPGTPVVSSDTLTIGTPGPVPGGGTITSPNITFQVAPSGGVGSTVSVQAAGTILTAHLQTVGRAQTSCTAPPSALVPGDPAVLATTAVVAPPPPPPGAPDAINDTTSTPKDTAVTIAVLDNDTKSGTGDDIDVASLTVKTAPAHGTAAVENGSIVYTPNLGYTGADTLQYTICSLVAEGEPACDSATVVITVQGAQATATTTTPTAAPTTATTVAPAAELPRTGGTSAPLAASGAFVVVAGLSLAGLFRRPRHAR